ncbi:protein of unknown function [Clostridium beijerinckii]|nr:protein of unknown function [Clostridium beijerinckii]
MAGIIKKIKSSVRGVQNNGNHYTAFYMFIKYYVAYYLHESHGSLLLNLM